MAPAGGRVSAAAAAPSLLELDLEHASLSQLKRCALRSNLESGWQQVAGREHTELLRDTLRTARLDWLSFVDTVRASTFNAYLERGQRALRRDGHMLVAARNAKREARERALSELEERLPRAFAAAVHIIPSGSGVSIGNGGLILTCAHCIAHDDDPEEEERAEGGSAVAERERSLSRVGRVKEIVTADGAVFGAVCIASDETQDLALLRALPGSSSPRATEELAPAAEQGTAVFALGNPYDWDLESSKPRLNGYKPFHVSGGRLQKVLAEEEARRKGVGTLCHSCWTYWGHSGCPIVSRAGVVGLHNSWDAYSKGQRHGVPLSELRAFVAQHAPEALEAGDAMEQDGEGDVVVMLDEAEEDVVVLDDEGEEEEEEELHVPLAERLAQRRRKSQR